MSLYAAIRGGFFTNKQINKQINKQNPRTIAHS